jgi:hypothetical protein
MIIYDGPEAKVVIENWGHKFWLYVSRKDACHLEGALLTKREAKVLLEYLQRNINS